MENKRAMIAMSGGVDSSTAAYLTQQAGYECIGATMQLLPDSSTDDALQVTQRLGIPFHAFDMIRQFQQIVMDAFTQAYEQGLTPNPCILCNRELKFGLLLQKALELDCDKVVTGHYARIEQDAATGRYLLKKAPDTAKDQTYFLYSLTQHQLSHTLFPLGELSKAQVRQIAQEQGFLNAQKRDSQDICFIPDGDYPAFLRRHTGKEYPQGSFLDLQGNVVGTHQGAVNYTLGQRKGLGIALGAPAYVCGKDMAANTVTVGPDEALYRRELMATEVNWISIPELTFPMRIAAKARSRMQEQPATVYPLEDGSVRVEFDQPQRALTPGQAVVFYDGDTVVGGGTITKVL